MAAAIKFAEDLGTEVIDIFVGPERKRYVVHKNPLITQSEYFRNAFKGDFKEAHENSIHLKEEDPAAVALLIGWVYRGVIPGTEKKISPFAQPFFNPPREKSTIPNADLINGSSYPFSSTSLPEENSIQGMRSVYQSICCQPQYNMFSQEELRMADYKVGRKYFDSVVRPGRGGPLGGNPFYHTIFGVPQPTSLFGTPQQASSSQTQIGSLPSQSTSLFGTVQPVHSSNSLFGATQPAQSSTSLFGTPQTAQSSSSTGLFGTPRPAPPQTTASTSAAVPPPSQASISLFGTSQPALSSSSTGLFGTPRPAPSQQTASTSAAAPSPPAQTTHDGGSSTNGNQTCAFALSSSAAAQTTSTPSTESSSSSGTSVPAQTTTSTVSNTRADSSESSTQNGNTGPNSTPATATQTPPAFAAHAGTGLLPFGLVAPSSSQSSSIFGTPAAASQSQTQPLASLFGNPVPSASQAHQRQPGWPHLASHNGGAHHTGGPLGPPPTGPLFASTWGGRAPNISSPVVIPDDDIPKGPGSFGWTPTIEYRKSAGVFIPGIPRSVPLDDVIAENQGQQLALLNLCLLAETILWPSLFNAAIEGYVRGELNLHRPIPPEHVTLIYNRTHSESTLRAYVLESMCTNRGDSLKYVELTRQYDELMEDILNILPDLRGPSSQVAPWSQDDLIRSFHMVDLGKPGKGKEKEKPDVDITGVFPKSNGESSS